MTKTDHPLQQPRQILGWILALSFLLVPRLHAQEAGPGVWLQPHIGVTEANRSLDVFGLGVHVNLSPALAVVGGVDRWSFDTSCPAEFPSTCGDDGWGFSVGLRIAAFTDAIVQPFIEPHVGLYRFSNQAREGHTTPSIGTRLGIAFSPGDVFRWEISGAVRHINGYDREALNYPGLRFTSAQVAVGVPIG